MRKRFGVVGVVGVVGVDGGALLAIILFFGERQSVIMDVMKDMIAYSICIIVSSFLWKDDIYI